MAVDIDCGGEINVRSVFMDFLSHGGTYGLDQFLVPGGGEQCTDREVRAIISVGIPFAGGLDTQARRAVGQHDGGDTESRNRIGGAGCAGEEQVGGTDHGSVARCAGHAGADDEMGFFLERHGFHDLVDGGFAKLGRTAGAKEQACRSKKDGGKFHII